MLCKSVWLFHFVGPTNNNNTNNNNNLCPMELWDINQITVTMGTLWNPFSEILIKNIIT